MKKFQIILKMIFMMVSFSLVGREVIITTQNGEAFLLEVSSSDSIQDVVKVAEVLMDPYSSPNKLLVEVDLSDMPTTDKFSWRMDLKRHGQYLGKPRDYHAALRPEEAADIRYIVTFLANRSLITIAANRNDLELAGERIDHLHPLRFLMHVFMDEELKVGIRNIRGKGWVWSDFISGLKESLSTEANHGNLTGPQIEHFARTIGIDPKLLVPSVAAHDWDQFIDLLIEKVPRKGDHGRYDS